MRHEMLSQLNRLIAEAPIEGARVGRILSFNQGEIRVDYDGNLAGPLLARASAALDDATLEAAARTRSEALLLFDRSDPTRPVVLTLLRSSTPLTEALLSPPGSTGGNDAHLEGKRILIEGSDELVLRCGDAKLTLRRDGTVVIRGLNIVSEARRVHKVRGGKVQIN